MQAAMQSPPHLRRPPPRTSRLWFRRLRLGAPPRRMTSTRKMRMVRRHQWRRCRRRATLRSPIAPTASVLRKAMSSGLICWGRILPRSRNSSQVNPETRWTTEMESQHVFASSNDPNRILPVAVNSVKIKGWWDAQHLLPAPVSSVHAAIAA